MSKKEKNTNNQIVTKKNNGKSAKKKIEHIPTSISDSIPYISVYENGIFEIKHGTFSKSYRVPEVNFKTASQSNQEKLAELYSDFINSFEAGVSVEVTLYNKTIDEESFKEQVFLKMKEDGLNQFREEYNEMLVEKMKVAKNNLTTEKIITVTLDAFDVFEATEKFVQVDAIVQENMALMTKFDVKPMDTIERLELLNVIYNQDDAMSLYEERVIDGRTVKSFTLENCASQGITTKDVIAPSGLKFQDFGGRVGNSYVKSYYVSNYPTWIKGTVLTDFSSLPTNMLTSVYFNPIDNVDGINLVKRQGVNISSKLIDAQKKAAKGGYDYSMVSPDLMLAKEETNELMDGITKDNGKLYTVTFVFTIFAKDEETLKYGESQLKMIANKNLLTIRSLDFQQENAFNSALPLGNNKLLTERLMTSLSIASIIPFDVKEVRQKKGMYYGLNALSRNMILYDRTTDMNPNGCILGMPGAGKSFAAKREIINVLLNTDDEVYIIDPEREYKVLAEAMDGSVIKIANGSDVHLNPFDLNIENTDDGGDPIKIKSDFITTICEIMVNGRFGLTPIEKSIIDNCVSHIYEPHVEYLRKVGKTQDIEHAPTLLDFYNDLNNQPYGEALNLALSLQRFVNGSFDIFSQRTNVDINNRLTVYDIKDVGPQLMELALQSCLDNIWNKMIQNFAKGKRTWIYIDEFYLMMKKPSAAAYISEIWKRARKWNGVPCAITQNVEDMLKSEEARTVINNCSFVMLLGQSPINKMQLSEMLGISQTEQKYISSAKPGMGLIQIKNEIIPMDDSFPTNTELYKIMTTKPDERV